MLEPFDYKEMRDDRNRWFERAQAHEATIADLQGQVVEAQDGTNALLARSTELHKQISQLQQRVAQLEECIGLKFDAETQTWVSGKVPYLSAGRTETEACIAAIDALRTVGSVLEEKYKTIQADHATLLGLVQAFIEAWDHDGEPDAMSYEVAVDQAKKYLASLPAQPAQGE